MLRLHDFNVAQREIHQQELNLLRVVTLKEALQRDP